VESQFDQANVEERQAVIGFLAAATTLIPALKVRFLERLPDQGRPFVRIGVALPAGITATSNEAYELHQLASDMSDTLPCNISVSTSPMTGGNMLLSMDNLVVPEAISQDTVDSRSAIKPTASARKTSWLKNLKWIAAFFVLTLLAFLAYNTIGLSIVSYLASGVQAPNNPLAEDIWADHSAGKDPALKSLNLKRREFLRALDDYIQSLLKQPGNDDEAGTKRLGTLQAMRDLVSNDSCFSSSGSTQEKQKK
jgi:hypothetical protein